MSTIAPTLIGGCLSKGRYPSLAKAQSRAAAAYLKRGVALRPYRCTFCGRWHLTKQAAEAPKLTGKNVPANPCAGCGEQMEALGFELKGARYHRRCRTLAMAKLPAEERRATLIRWADEGQPKPES